MPPTEQPHPPQHDYLFATGLQQLSDGVGAGGMSAGDTDSQAVPFGYSGPPPLCGATSSSTTGGAAGGDENGESVAVAQALQQLFDERAHVHELCANDEAIAHAMSEEAASGRLSRSCTLGGRGTTAESSRGRASGSRGRAGGSRGRAGGGNCEGHPGNPYAELQEMMGECSGEGLESDEGIELDFFIEDVLQPPSVAPPPAAPPPDEPSPAASPPDELPPDAPPPATSPPAAPPTAAPPTAVPPPAIPPPAVPPTAVPPTAASPPAVPPPAAPPPAVDALNGESNAAPRKRRRGRRGGASHPRADEFFECSDDDFIEEDDGYTSNGSACTTGGPRRRRAFLVAEGEGGTARHLAFGETSVEDGVFVVATVYEDGEGVDIAGQRLTGILNLQDLHDAGLGLDWAEEELEDEGEDDAEEAAEAGHAAEPAAPEEAAEKGDAAEPAAPLSGLAALLEKEAVTWREQACELEDELQWYRDALDAAHAQLAQAPASNAEKLLGRLRGIQVRVDVDDPDDTRKSRLANLDEFVRSFPPRAALPILTTMERTRRAQQAAASTKNMYAKRRDKREREQDDELHQLREQHKAELQELRRKHEAELQAQARQYEAKLQSLRDWKRIEGIQQRAQAKSQHEQQVAAHAKELAARAKRTATWQAKRKNMQRALRRAANARDEAHAHAESSAADARAAEADNAALHAQLGESIKVAKQRDYEGKRAPFTFRTILRDLMVRFRSLNSGAANVGDVSRVYSANIADDGRDLKLESGSRRSVLRWEKIVDVLCMLREGRMLRNALRAAPRTRFWMYVDLSPDARAVEQCGMGIEYGGISYRILEAARESDAPPLTLRNRLSGQPYQVLASGVQLGPDGCPVTVEWFRRVFLPMLAAHGPKYAATADCVLRNLQLYGSPPSQLLKEAFEFATSERADIPIPLLDRLEGFVSDAGGEVHKSGGLLDTVAPGAVWRHCMAHGLNLSLEKAEAFKEVGGDVRSLASFCRGGNKHSMLVTHMLYIQKPSMVPVECDARRRQMYLDAHEQLCRHGQFHAALGAADVQPARLQEGLTQLALVSEQIIENKQKKGNDTRWRFECETVDDRLLDVAHLLAPAILIEYGVGKTYDALTINEEKNKTAHAALALLVSPKFIFWATEMRLIYQLVYKQAFDQVQFNHHRNAPAVAGPSGLPVDWAAAMRSAVKLPKRKGGTPQLDPVVAKPLVTLLQRHPCLGGLKGKLAIAAANDFCEQAEHIESYFIRWNSLEALVHAVAHEHIIQGPLPKEACELISQEAGVGYSDLLPRVPSAQALAAAQRGLQLFDEMTPDERCELPGTLSWLLFSSKTRNGATNEVYAELCAFAKGELNPVTGEAYPYRCWHELAQVLVAGGAKGCPTTSAQLEGLFNSLTRQQGASKVNISQPQMSYEARCPKNDTMDSLTESALRDGWDEAVAVKAVLDNKGFWSCDIDVAANRKLCQKLKEQMEVEEADAGELQEAEETYEVEKIVRHEMHEGVLRYVVKWVDWESEHNTYEPEEHLLTCKALLTYWRSKKIKKEIERVTELQEKALQEKAQLEDARRRRRAKPLDMETEVGPQRQVAGSKRPAAATAASRPDGANAADATCRAAYDGAHGQLAAASALVFDTETSGFGGCVLNLGWVLADGGGKELAAYDRLWCLPKGERIHSGAYKAHGISLHDLRRASSDAVLNVAPEVGEFFALVAAARAAGVRIVAHNASFDVARLNHTAHRHKLRGATSLCSADMLCTMYSATKHCGLRTRGNKRLKAPRNEELYQFLFEKAPTERLHRALADCRVTLASYVEGRKRHWW
jgi:DNA polymerase III epsilon subunit-like protein